MVNIAKTKRPEEQESYLRMTIQQCWSVCEVARQIESAFFESAVLNPPTLSTALRELNPGAESLFAMQMFFNVLSFPMSTVKLTCIRGRYIIFVRFFACPILLSVV